MICATCAAAASRHAPRNEHCDATGGPGAACDCQHRTDRYQPAPLALGPVLAIYEHQAADTDAHADAVEAAIARVEADHGPDDVIRIPHADTPASIGKD